MWVAVCDGEGIGRGGLIPFVQCRVCNLCSVCIVHIYRIVRVASAHRIHAIIYDRDRVRYI